MSVQKETVMWLAEVRCPKCADRVTVPVDISSVSIYNDGLRRSLVVSFEDADVSHRCPNPDRDKTGAAS